MIDSTAAAEQPGAGELIWAPSSAQQDASRLADYLRWLRAQRDLAFDDYASLQRWSVTQLEAFWQSIWDYFDVRADGSPEPVLASRAMPGARWWPNTRINYAEHAFRQETPERPALIARSEDAAPYEVSWASLRRDTGALAATLRALGVQPGDRVASYLPNRPETVAAFLACAAIGAVWSSCGPDMGATVVLDRLKQIEPVVLFATDSYRYNGTTHDRAPVVETLLAELPSVRKIIHVDGPLARERATNWRDRAPGWRDRLTWSSAIETSAPLTFERFAFDHPLWIVYSSGTTGLPKAMVHGHGGIVLTQLKTMALQHDLRPGDRLLFLGGTGWIVWNLQVGSLLTGATIILYDGNPAWPDRETLWRSIDRLGVTLFGCGSAYLIQCMKDQLSPRSVASFERLRAINATGSPLPVEAYHWTYREVKRDLWLASVSGGTDVASGFVACAPLLPVHTGEIQCRELGVAAEAFDENGRSVIGEVGELVITAPMPSMPIRFWNDPNGERYRESYFEMFPGVWRQGDWIRFSKRGTAVIFGRSDSTINRAGIRIGTAELYRVVEAMPEIADSLVVDLEYLGRPSFLALFVVLRAGHSLDDALKASITREIRTKASARHVPNEVYAIDDVPRTLTGKKMEVPIRKLLLGTPAARVAHREAMANPASLDFFIHLATTLAARMA